MADSTTHRSALPRRRARRVVLTVVGLTLGLVTVLLTVVLVLGGALVPAAYLEPWSRTYSDRFSDPRVKAVAGALLAPSSHNMQPWTVWLDASDARSFSLFADPARLTPAVDPLARQAMVSQGTFLAYLHVAAARLGYRATVAVFTSGGYDETRLAASMRTIPVARITLVRTALRPASNDASLYRSDTNRSPYAAAMLTEGQRAVLGELDGGPGATLRLLTGPADVARLGALGRQGTRIETEYAAATRESDHLFFGTEGAKNLVRYGFAVEGQGTSGFMKYLLQGAIRMAPSLNDDATAAAREIASTDAAVAHTPAYGLITTVGNTRVDQVRAGMLYADASLTARTLGLVMQPLSQVLQEYPTMAAPYRAVHKEFAAPGQTIQMLVRIGTPTVDYPPTMRRDAGALLATR